MPDLDKLKPYFYRKAARQRLILYLLSSGYDVERIINLTSVAFHKIDLPKELEIYREEISKPGTLWAFEYKTNRRRLNTYDVYKLLRTTSEKVLGKAISVTDFQNRTN